MGAIAKLLLIDSILVLTNSKLELVNELQDWYSVGDECDVHA